MAVNQENLQSELQRLRKKKRLKELQAKAQNQTDPFIESAEQPFEGVSGPESTGVGSAALTAGTGAVTQTVSGIGGLAQLASGQGAERTAKTMENFQRDFTAKPTPEAAELLSSLGEKFEKLNSWLSLSFDVYDALATGAVTNDVMQGLEQFSENREDPGARADRSLALGPGAATATSIGPDVALEAISAGFGVAGVKTAVRVADRIQAKSPSIQVFDEAGKFTDEAIEALKQMPDVAEEASQILTPEQAERLNLFKEKGVTPLAADVTRKTEDSIDQQQAIKEGGVVAEIAADQERQLTNLVEQGITETGGIAFNAEEASASIRSAITDVATELDNKVTEAYNVAKQRATGESVDISDYIDFVRTNKGKDKITGGVVTSALTDLRNKGLLEKGANPVVSVETAEEIRQGLNKDFDSAKPRGRAFIREMKEAIDSDVEQTVGADVFADAREANVQFKSALKRARRDKFDKSKGSLLEDILDNKIPEEKIFDKIVSATTRAEDVEKLRDFLLRFGNKQAWDDLRAQVLRSALDKSISTKQFREGGDPVFNVRLFENELKRIKGKKFDALFNADEKQLIQDIREIGNARIPISGTFSGEGPSSIAVRRATAEVRDTLLGRIPAVGPLAEGMIDAMRKKKRDKALTQFTNETEKAIKEAQ